MGSFSLVHWAILIIVVMLLFGRGRISDLMGDFAKGITSFKKGLAEGDAPPAATPPLPQVTSAGATQVADGIATPVAPASDEIRR